MSVCCARARAGDNAAAADAGPAAAAATAAAAEEEMSPAARCAANAARLEQLKAVIAGAELGFGVGLLILTLKL